MALVVAFLCVVIVTQSIALMALAWAVLKKQGLVAPVLTGAPKKQEPLPEEPKPQFFQGVAGVTSLNVVGPK